jgi:hypothetical protein
MVDAAGWPRVTADNANRVTICFPRHLAPKSPARGAWRDGAARATNPSIEHVEAGGELRTN